MAPAARQNEKAVQEWLVNEGPAFDFFQAVRLLELTNPDSAQVGEQEGCDRPEPVRFRARVGFDFSATAIQQIFRSKDDPEPPGSAMPRIVGKRDDSEPPVMVTNFFGLAGANNPLPTPLTELVVERLREKDRGMRDFLDIFNHRLISILYRIRKLHRVGLSSTAPEDAPAARHLYAILGLGVPALRGRMALGESSDTGDRALLPYAGLLSRQPRSTIGLGRMLQHHFRVLVKVEQFAGVWRRIEKDQWTRLGTQKGRNNKLGGTAALGTRFWDSQGRFWIILGPLTLRQFVHFLPGGRAHLALCEMTRFYAGDEMDFRMRLRIRAAEIPETRLLRPPKTKEQQPGRSRLGWTTWLRTHPTKHDSQVAIAPMIGSR